jgi:cell division protein FtsL
MLEESSIIQILQNLIFTKQLKEKLGFKMSEKNVAMRNAVIALSVVCAILIIAIPVIWVNDNSIFQLKDKEINRLSGVVNQKDSQIGDLQNQIKSLKNNQVQVSGTVQVTQTGTIYFRNLNRTIETSVPITNGKYSVLLVGDNLMMSILATINIHYMFH